MSRLATLSASAALALFLVMGWYSYAALIPAAAGQLPFDAQVLGYAPQWALAYLETLDSRGRAVYLLEMRWLDAAFMASFALALGLGMLVLSRGRALWLRGAMLLVVLAYLACDWAENTTVRALLLRGPEGFLPPLAEWASLFTRLKFAFALLCLLILGGLWRRFGRKG